MWGCLAAKSIVRGIGLQGGGGGGATISAVPSICPRLSTDPQEPRELHKDWGWRNVGVLWVVQLVPLVCSGCSTLCDCDLVCKCISWELLRKEMNFGKEISSSKGFLHFDVSNPPPRSTTVHRVPIFHHVPRGLPTQNESHIHTTTGTPTRPRKPPVPLSSVAVLLTF